MDANANHSWRAVKRPHDYPDGTTFRWAVEYTDENSNIVEIADWLNERSAHRVAAAPELLAALKDCVDRFVDAFPASEEYGPIRKARAAIAKAEGGAS